MTDAADTGAAIPLRLTEKAIHDATLRSADDGTYEIRTTGSDPYVFTEPLPQPPDARQHVLAFEYFSATGAGAVQVFLVPPLDEVHSVTGAGLSHSEGWSSYAIDLKPALDRAGGVRALRIDFGSAPGKALRIRALRLRPLTEDERRLAARRAALRAGEQRREARLRGYLRRAYPCRVTRVAVGDQQIRVEGAISGERRGLLLAEAPLYADVTGSGSFPFVQAIRADGRGRFALALPRYRRAFDRLLSRWVVVRRSGGGYALLSHARCADAIRPRADLPEQKPRNKKGIGALGPGRPLSDLDDLGIAAATVNVVISRLLHTAPGAGRTPFRYAGRTWYSDDGEVGQLDRTLLEAAKRRLVVSAILLVEPAGSAPAGSFRRLVAHPDADPAGIFVMPDVSGEEGFIAYAAALDFLAGRYSRADNRHGRIHHWIVHNEVNAGWVWTNAGEKSALLYMDLYQKSLRAVSLIARGYDPHARAFISLEHHWSASPDPRIYAGRDLLGLLEEFSEAEGDFDWGIAFHPYPENLFDPRVWEDTEARFAFDTPKITFKNLEVLDAWVRRGKRRRTVHLSEQGLNSRDYSAASLRDQAAGMAYAWNKYKDLDSVEIFHYHNWVDNRNEGGLRIGLRRFPDDADDPLGRKPIWFVYQALGTIREEPVTAPYKPVIGIREWSEVRYRGRIR